MAERYVYSIGCNKVVCVSHYAGKAVRGIAKCSPEDTFDVETGKRLAKARCDYKVAKKRMLRATDKLEEAKNLVAYSHMYFDNMQSYYNDASKELELVEKDLTNLEKSFQV